MLDKVIQEKKSRMRLNKKQKDELARNSLPNLPGDEKIADFDTDELFEFLQHNSPPEILEPVVNQVIIPYHQQVFNQQVTGAPFLPEQTLIVKPKDPNIDRLLIRSLDQLTSDKARI